MKTTLSLLAVLVTLCFTGCAALRQEEVTAKEKNLAASGFQARPVTAEKQAAFARLTPYKLQSRVHKGAVVYLYPDPKQNVCYVGGPQQYSIYQQRVRTQEAITRAEMSATDWGYWGPGALGPGFAPATFGGVPNVTN